MDNRLFINKKTIFVAMLVMLLIIATISVGFYAMSAMQKSKIKKAINAAWQSESEEKSEYLVKLDSLSSYEITSIEKKDERYIIKTIVTAPDLGERLFKIGYSNLPKDKDPVAINNFLCEQIKEARIKKTNAKIYAYKINDKYDITFSDTFVDAMSGKVYKYSLKAFEDIAKTTSKEDGK